MKFEEDEKKLLDEIQNGCYCDHHFNMRMVEMDRPFLFGQTSVYQMPEE